jgi:UDP-GlcNAc:undecaprenyl-phosphate GlcNAc-1-phosphate transferase
VLQACAALFIIGFLISLAGTAGARALGRRLGALDSPGAPGHAKVLRKVPNTGGIGIFLGLWVPILAAVIGAIAVPGLVAERFPSLDVPAVVPLASLLLLCLAVLHATGLRDDRVAMRPGIKLAIMATAAAGIAVFGDGTRLFTFADAYAGGPWLSVLLTVVWILAVTNALNFMDNMDGLAAGVGVIAGACFLAAAAINGQWLVSGCLALLVGSLLGFLVFNFPPATIFMGDGGSLVVGFMLAFLTVRTTYVGEGGVGFTAGAWYGVFMPLVVLAVPVYDLVSVTIIRLSQRRSPLVGDQQHLSHRLVSLGLSRRSAVLVIWGFTAVTGLSGVMLASLRPWQAALVGVQTVVMLLVIGMFEWRRARAGT